MGRSKRDQMKRKMAQTYVSLDNSLSAIREVHTEFDDVHPDLAEGLENAAQLIITSQEVILAFTAICWNTDKTSLLTYR